jgi:hypothetical protein
LSDNSGAIQVTFWDQNAEEYADLSIGENIKVNNVSVKNNTRTGVNSASFGRNSTLERDIDFELTDPHVVQGLYSSPSKSSISFRGKYTSISQIEQGNTYEIKGNISELKRISSYEACAKCLKNISIDENNCTCEEGPENSVFRMIISAVINDGTGDLAITFFGEKAEELIRKEAVDIHVKKQDPNYSEFEKEIEESLKMMDLAVIGYVSPNSYSEEIEMKVRDFKVLDLEEDDSIDELIDDIEN